LEPGGAKGAADFANAPYTSQRRDELLILYGQLQKWIEQLVLQVAEQCQQRPQARRLLTHPGVGPVTASATEVFSRGAESIRPWQPGSQLHRDHPVHTSGKRQRLGKMTEQGNSLLRYLCTEAVCMRYGKTRS
jgi:transposase